MQFSVIYSVDVPEDTHVLDYAPPKVSDLWDETEDDAEYDCDDLEGEWEHGHHRKWCAILDREQFEDFLDRCRLFAETVETMGSLGAPGFGFGWTPALSFRGDDPNAIQNAYVTPVPETSKERLHRKDWQRVRRAMLAVYG